MKDPHITAYLESKFPRDSKTGALEVRLRFNSYDELFEPLDGAPLGRKSLSSGLVRGIYEIFQEIPLEYDYMLVAEIPSSLRNEEREEACRKDFARWCRYRRVLASRKVRRNNRKTLIYAALAGVLIAGSLGLEHAVPTSTLWGDLVDQALTVGWWIFAWQAGSNLLLHWEDVREPLRQFQRLEAHPLRFDPLGENA